MHHMKSIACAEALRLLEQGWDDGLENIALKTALYHLTHCSDCAAAVAGWSRAELLLDAYSAAVDRSDPRRSVADRVHRHLLRERGSGDLADQRAVEEADLVRFLARLQEDEGLRQRLSTSVSRETVFDLLVTLAAEGGLYFTIGTVRGALEKVQASNDGELSDEQLEAVAGGASQQLMWLQEWVSRLPSAASPG